MRIAVAADHAGFEMKNELAENIRKGGHEVVDLGAHSYDAGDDYPDFAEALGRAVQQGDADRGVLICGSGVGASIAANKLDGVRAGLCHDSYSAHQGVEHDDMNVLVLGSRIIGIELARDLVRTFLGAQFSGDARHARRLDKVKRLETLAVLLLIASVANAQDLTQARQLTSGGQNAEAYWSPDGKRLVFQSTRDGASCDQIFVMDADGANVKRISNGQGATTCGYFLPDGKHVLYASTHGGGPSCPPRPDRSKGYMWAIPSSYDIYVADLDGKLVRTLTDKAGYDAEATVNWKRRKIVYTSKESGDLDLWSMNPDGSGKKRLTTAAGYDGGAFYSPDGSKLVWRAHRPGEGTDMQRYKDLLGQGLTAPMKMEIFIASADGSGARQITKFGCASFAPQFTPDGKQIIFSSNKNKCDSREFELFLMNLDGSNIRQVTSFGGFTSFPDFSPDGRRIAFTSSWKAKSPYEFNIFVAEWK